MSNHGSDNHSFMVGIGLIIGKNRKDNSSKHV